MSNTMAFTLVLIASAITTGLFCIALDCLSTSMARVLLGL